MASIPQKDLSSALSWFPWPPGDPAPEIWRIIYELDRRIQVQVIQTVLETQIATAKAHVEGLAKIHKIVSGAKIG